MRFLRLLGCVLLSWVGLETLAGGGPRGLAQNVFEPYFVYVDQEGVTARCGPGGDYYRTDPLRHGQRLEVYLESDDGWLGVRPPEGSFCWVTAESLELDRGGNTGRVIEDAALAWIGTHLGKARKYLWQVQMPHGEEVTILGRAEREGAEGPQLWYRIVPPSGEFRWVHRDQVVDSPELLLRDKPHPEQRLAQGSPTPVDDSLAQRDGAKPQKPAAQSVLSAAPQANSSSAAGPESAVRLHAISAPEAIPLVVSALPHDLPATAATRSADSPPAGQEASEADAGALLAAADLLAAPPIGSGVAASPELAAGSAPLLAGQSPAGVQPAGVQPIGAVNDPSATVQASGSNRSSDDNWVRGSQRSARAGGTVPGGAITGGAPGVASAGTPMPAPLSVDALQLQLTRHMAATARAADLEPLRLAAEAIAVGHASPAERQRGRLLAERVQQVQSVARRRDGEREPAALAGAGALAGANALPGVAAASSAAAIGSGGALPGREPGEPHGAAAAPAKNEVRGYLVQVYSARPDSPPFALTDAAGRTTHYVSPSPGLNLRRYLNQHITLSGQTGYETGLDTPHLIASHAVASPELR